jgi:type I restriction enzyme S subunit
MKQVMLKDISEIISGSTPKTTVEEYWGGEINWFTPKDLSKIEGKYVSVSGKQITQSGYESCSTRMLPEKSILYSSRAPIGHIAINKEECCTNQGFKSFVPNEDVDINYLYYALTFFTPQIKNLGRGATFKEVSKTDIGKVKIPLPDIEVQKKIAFVLDKADEIIKLRQKSIEKLQELERSLFYEMFGDPSSSKTKTVRKKIEDIVNVSSGSTPNRKEVSYWDNGSINWVKTGEVVGGEINETEEKITEKALRETSCKLLSKNTVLVAMYGQGKTRGRVGILGVESATNQACAALEFEDRDIALFTFYQLKLMYKSLRKLGRGGNQENLNTGMIKTFEIIMPDQDMIKKYLTKINCLNKLYKLLDEGMKKDKALFNSLLQKSFKGELKISDKTYNKVYRDNEEKQL